MNRGSIHSLFPTAVMIFTLDDPVTELELKTIQSLDYHENVGNRTSNNSNLFELKALSRLRDTATDYLNQYIAKIYDTSNDVEAYVTQSWANYTKGSEYHHRHSHANSFLSGVLFVESNKDDKIQFYTPVGHRGQLKLAPKNFNQFNSTTWWLPAEKNSVVIFPSWLTHEVPITNRQTDRISLAFNSFVKGTVGDGSKLTELVL